MPPPIAATELFHSHEIKRFLLVMGRANPNFCEACETMAALFFCMPGDRENVYTLSDMKNILKTLLYQRPDYYEAVKTFRGYVGMQEAFEDYGQRRPQQLAVDW